MRFDRHTIVLLMRPHDAPSMSDAELEAIQDAHLARQAELRERGHIVAAGPFVDQDDERFRGISVLAVAPEEARRLYAEDAAVLARRLEAIVLTWMVPAGNVRFERVSHPRSSAEAEED